MGKGSKPAADYSVAGDDGGDAKQTSLSSPVAGSTKAVPGARKSAGLIHTASAPPVQDRGSMLPGALVLERSEDGDDTAQRNRPKKLDRTESKGSLQVDSMASVLRDRSFVLKGDPTTPTAGGGGRPRNATWKNMVVKTNMTNALKSLNLEHRSIYGDDIGGIDNMLGQAAHDHKEWIKGMGKVTGIVGGDDTRCFLLSPECRFRQVWDAVQVILLVYVSIMVPLRFAFTIESVPLTAGWWWELLVDLYFITDILLNFRTGYLSVDHQLIMDPKMIARRYLTGWFPIDVVACAPIGYVSQIIGGESQGTGMKAFKTLRLFRLAKLLRLARIRRIIKRWEESIGSMMALIKLVVLLLTVLFLTHLIACLWYFVGENDPAGWVHTWDLELDADNKGHLNYTSWQQHDILHKYLRSYYWGVGLVSSSARGDIPPNTSGEFVFVILCEVIGTVTCGVILGTLSSMFMASRLLEEKVDRELAELREFLEVRRIPKKLKLRVRRYMEHLFRRKTGYNEKELLEHLPPALSSELLNHLYREQVENVPLFHGLSDQLVAKLCQLMKPVKSLKGDFVYREREICREFFIIEDGTIEISRYEVLLARLSNGAAFGEEALRPGKNRRSRTALAITDCDLVIVTQDDVLSLFAEYPELAERLEDVQSKRRKKEQQRLKGMMDETASKLGVSTESAVMSKIMERTQAMAEELEHEGAGGAKGMTLACSAQQTDLTTEAEKEEAALNIARHYRGYRCRYMLEQRRKDMKVAMTVEDTMIEEQAQHMLALMREAERDAGDEESEDTSPTASEAAAQAEPTMGELAAQLHGVMQAVASLQTQTSSLQTQLQDGLKEVRLVTANASLHLPPLDHEASDATGAGGFRRSGSQVSFGDEAP